MIVQVFDVCVVGDVFVLVEGLCQVVVSYLCGVSFVGDVFVFYCGWVKYGGYVGCGYVQGFGCLIGGVVVVVFDFVGGVGQGVVNLELFFFDGGYVDYVGQWLF